MPPSDEVLKWSANRPPMGTVGDQPYPLRLAIYVLSWGAVTTIVLRIFLPVSWDGIQALGWF